MKASKQSGLLSQFTEWKPVRAVLILAGLLVLGVNPKAGTFKAGTAVVDISPTGFPVIVNAMFTERTATNTVDPLTVRAIVMEDGTERVAIAVVDTCMMARTLIDEAKKLAAAGSGIREDHMLVSATHTHSAPSAMGCLGSRMDTNYARFLVPKIADAIVQASSRLVPARAGWTVFDATGYTHNRRWIRRSDRIELDPFGERTVRAHMHPGYQSPDAIGPSGPVDAGFTLFSIVDSAGSPLALLGNFSMHYYESALVSSDYFGKWCSKMESRLAAHSKGGRPVLAVLSQGTSGDLMWMNYGAARNQIGYEAYSEQLAGMAYAAWKSIEHRDRVPIRMKESLLPLGYRLCDPNRLAWARRLSASLGGRLPQTLPEIYALEQLQLHERGRTELKLQALRLGGFGITAIPNEVFAITGLKLKEQSPLQPTMNVELANGGEGYIPPPEQHALGGYTTWAARTAGLETNAEPRITEALLGLLEDVSGKKRIPAKPQSDLRSRLVLKDRPLAYWRLDEPSGTVAHDASGNRRTARLDGLLAYWLDGPAVTAEKPQIANRAVHFVHGSLQSDVELGKAWTIEFWVWNGNLEPLGASAGEILRVARAGEPGDPLRLSLGGRGAVTGQLALGGAGDAPVGRQTLAPRVWHHVAWTFDAGIHRILVNGRPDLEWKQDLAKTGVGAVQVRFGGGDGREVFQGKLDDVAIYPRALQASEIRSHLVTK